VATFNVNINTQISDMSELSLANVEVLEQTSDEDVIFDCSDPKCRVCGESIIGKLPAKPKASEKELVTMMTLLLE
jgi:hypothetical protein